MFHQNPASALFRRERKLYCAENSFESHVFFDDEHIQRLLLILVLAKNVCISIGIKLSSYWHREQISTLNILYIYLSAFSIFFSPSLFVYSLLWMSTTGFMCAFILEMFQRKAKKIHIWIECRAHLLQRSLYTA